MAGSIKTLTSSRQLATLLPILKKLRQRSVRNFSQKTRIHGYFFEKRSLLPSSAAEDPNSQGH